MILSKKRITKPLIRLRGCAGWSVPVLLANPRRQVFSRRGPVEGTPSTVNVLKFRKLFSFISKNKMYGYQCWNSWKSKQGRPWSSSLIWACPVCLGLYGRQQLFKILEHLLYFMLLFFLHYMIVNPMVYICMCLCITSHQQQRSYGEEATALSLIQQTGKVGDRTRDPWFTRWVVVYPLHHSGS